MFYGHLFVISVRTFCGADCVVSTKNKCSKKTKTFIMEVLVLALMMLSAQAVEILMNKYACSS